MFLSLTQQIRCFFSNKVILRQWKEEAELVSGTGYGEVCIEPEGTSLQIHFTVVSLPNFPSLLQHRINNSWMRCTLHLSAAHQKENWWSHRQDRAGGSCIFHYSPEHAWDWRRLQWAVHWPASHERFSDVHRENSWEGKGCQDQILQANILYFKLHLDQGSC